MRARIRFGAGKEIFAAQFFENDATPGGYLKIPGFLDRQETQKAARAFAAKHQGLNKAHAPAVLTEGMEWVQVTTNPSDSQLIEALQYATAQLVG